MKKNKNAAGTALLTTKKSLGARIYHYRWFYLMFLPVFIFAVVFSYIPMAGIRYAFASYKGANIKWIGWKNFETMFNMPNFWNAVKNTLILSTGKLLLNTGMAVIISLFLNEIVSLKFKKTTQTIIYLPHFMSWVVTASVFTLMLSPTQEGLVNALLTKIGAVTQGQEIYFLSKTSSWTWSYFIINIWKDTGWGTIIFLATLSGINPEQYEAAAIDGAGRWKKMRYITFPSIRNTIITVLILNLAKVMNLFESVFVMQNDAVQNSTNVLQTYIYYQTFNSGALPDYGRTTAVGLFKSLVGCVLVVICNMISKKLRNGRGIV